MPSPDVKNYMYGKGEVFFRAQGAAGFEHLGNTPAFGLTVEIERTDHFSSMRGSKEKDASFVNQKSAKLALTLEEFSSENLNRALFGSGVNALNTDAGTMDEESVSVSKDAYVRLGHRNVFFTRVALGAVTGGPFQIGETVTGGTSSATGKIAWSDDSVLELVAVAGVFENGETLTGGTSSASAPAGSIERVEDVVAVDSDTPTKRYVQGTDYALNAVGGMLLAKSGGTIATSVVVSADYAAVNAGRIDGLTADEIVGEVLFVGAPAQGPKLEVSCWAVSLAPSGDIGFISDEIGSIALEGDCKSDRVNHPDSPFFSVTNFGAA